MSFDRFPFGFTEADTEFLVGGAATTGVSLGCRLSNPRHGALGLELVIENPSGGGFGAMFDAIVQTATDGVTTTADWVDTNTRINGINAAGVFTVQVADPVLDRVRLRYAGVGFLGFNSRVHWMSDKQPTVI